LKIRKEVKIMDFGNIINTIGNAINIVTNLIENTKIVEVLNKVGEGIADWFKNTFNMGEAPSYDRDTATIDETKKMNEILQIYIEKCISISKEYDDISKNEINKYYEQIKKNLLGINNISKNNSGSSSKIIDEYIIESLDMNKNEILNNLDEFYSKKIKEAYSLNNSELLDILKMEKGSKKTNKMNKFSADTLTNANEALFKRLEDSLKLQQNLVEKKLKDYIDSKDREAKRNIERINEILETNQKGETEKQALKNNYIQLLDEVKLFDEIFA
jgi:hypothetical protein